MSATSDKEESNVEMEVDSDGGDNRDSNAATSSTEDGKGALEKDSHSGDDNGGDAIADDQKKNGSSSDIVKGDGENDGNEEGSLSGKKRPRSPSEDSSKEKEDRAESKKREAIVAMLEVKKPECSTASSAASTRDSEKISIASVAAASQLSSAMGWNGLGSLLSLSLLTNNGNSSTSSSNERSRASRTSLASSGSSSGGGTSGGSNNFGSLPSKEQVLQASIKAVNDSPPFVHLSKTDSAPQLKITDSECAVGTIASDATGSPSGTDTSAAENANATETTAASASASAIQPSTSAAPILVNDRLACKQGEGEMRGYRMTRGSHGVAPGSGNFYYEVVILEPPTARELVKSLPPNVRLGKKLQREMEKALRAEEEAEREQRENKASRANESSASAAGGDKPEETKGTTSKPSKPSSSSSSSKSTNTTSNAFGAHVRLGWSMRTGDLQAPVGYDKWSYGIRDIQGSKIHCSRRDDNWGGEEFGPGDVVGCAISMVSGATETGGESASANDANDSSNAATSDQDQHPRANENHIRFFKNGLPMGEFVITKGKREGGAAFVIPDGVYYPAISLYMGATVKVNFGPHFIHPPRKLPSGMSLKPSKKKGGNGGGGSNSSVFQPVSNLCKAPLSVEESSAKVAKEQKTLFFRKADNTAQQKRFLELVETEVRIQQDAYQNHRKKHVLDVMEERKLRKLKCDDLEQDEFFANSAGGAAADANASS